MSVSNDLLPTAHELLIASEMVAAYGRQSSRSATAAEHETVTINPAFLKELKEIHEELWNSLVELHFLCSRPVPLGPQCRRLLDAMKVIRDLLALQFTLEESFGYFSSADPIATDAGISSRAEDLKWEHRELLGQFSRLVDQTQQWLDDQRYAHVTMIVPLAYDEFFQRLQAHETAEIRLIQDAWLYDIGTGD